ncbi:HNH homing endonuclease [Bacillus phage AR9]|uniref:HNH homing endonuclease n=2 Tax=Bacillus phage PBS1 TaxID=10683 RepID=A0A172JIG4_BPPB1|nr:HNH endonuclease [Bacillus phage AR9]YP_009664364.1 HNH endonuclease [Bacillus phage PBS1]AMS01355.1 HNH homing endonuclease [Bacillus phage AR9]AST99984.1 HNH endonuclease [Bacillus phage PBS1]BDE75501.1 endonuclease [Bacillus phage PBS1]
MELIWKEIIGFEGLYEISNTGLVKSLKREVSGKLNSIRIIDEKILSSTNNGKGYLVVTLYRDKKRYYKKIHRLVAEAFIENSENKPEVNHKDGIKTNNCVSNLEWSTTKENCNHRQKTGLGNINNATKAKYKPIAKLDLTTGEIISTYKSVKEVAKEFDCKIDAIARVARGQRNSYKGYGFKYI